IISLLSISCLGHAFADVTIPPNFIIFQNGTNYQVKNGTSGVIIYTGTDLGVVEQSAINSLPSSTGGTIDIRPGNYIQMTPVDLKALDKLVFEKGAIVSVTHGYAKSVFRIGSGINWVTIDGGRFRESGAPQHNWTGLNI